MKSTIKILFVTNWLKRRGAEQQLYRFIKELPEHVKVSIFRFSNDKEEFPELFEYRKAEIFSNPYSGAFNVLKIKPLRECLRKQNYDAVVTVGLGSALLFGRIGAALSGVKMVYSVLNTFENFNRIPNLSKSYFDPLNKALNILLPRLFRRKVFRFLPNSNQLTKKIRNLASHYLIDSLPNGLPMEDIHNLKHYKPDRTTKQIHRIIKYYPTIVQVGALDETKNPEFVLKCFHRIQQKIPDARLLFIGEGQLKSEMLKWSFANGIEKSVIFTGQLSMMNCLYLMEASDVLVLTSVSESFPNVLLEGQALSLPVVTFDVGATSEIIKQGVTGFVVKNNNQKEFTEHLIKLLANQALAKKMGQKGRQRVFESFSMQRKVSKFMSMIEKDLANDTQISLAESPLCDE